MRSGIQFDMSQLPLNIQELFEKRERLRKDKKFKEADEIRILLKLKGYDVIDEPSGSKLSSPTATQENKLSRHSPKIALFGSGEMSPTGRKIHEYMIKEIGPPVKIALLETPTGYEANPHQWYQKLSDMMKVGLQNYQPDITLVEALRNDGEKSTNNPDIANKLLDTDYIHTGAGSPTYAIKHLKDSLAYKYLRDQSRKIPVSFASAAAISLSNYALPVYEIYKVGEDPYWNKGLNFFEQWGLNLTIIPHWNNTEGGDGIDTSRCFVGKRRYGQLIQSLPPDTVIAGIDEQTALVFEMETRELSIIGNGTVTIIKKGKETILQPNQKFSLDIIS